VTHSTAEKKKQRDESTEAQLDVPTRREYRKDSLSNILRNIHMDTITYFDESKVKMSPPWEEKVG